MQFFVNDQCVGCQLCACICPDVFQMTDAGVAHARPGDVDDDVASCGGRTARGGAAPR